MNSPVFNKYGYPTEETIELIRKWDYKDVEGCLNFMKEAWWNEQAVTHVAEHWHFSTCGWSGNESLISALQENLMVWALSWHSSVRGGHFTFKVLSPK